MRLSGVLVGIVMGAASVISSHVMAQQASTGKAATQSVLSTAAPAAVDDSQRLRAIKTAFETRFQGVEVTNVRQAPMPGLYEVQVGMDLVYVDENVDYVLQGSLVDAHKRVDLTAARIQKLSEVPFDTLPLELAVKQVKGDGSRKLAVFEDPNCVYCKQLHANLKDIDNVTVYSFLFPILSPDSATKARDVWCASDPAAVWRDWMVNGNTPPSAQCDDDPVEQVLALGQRLAVRGTPAVLFADGSRVNGVLPADQLRRKLDELN